MSDESQVEVPEQVEGQDPEVSEKEQGKDTEAKKFVTVDMFDELAERLERYSQGLVDKRFHKVSQDIKQFQEMAEAAGLELSPQQRQRLEDQAFRRAMMNQTNQQQDTGNQALPNVAGQVSQAQAGQQAPQIVQWANQTLAAAGVPPDAPELKGVHPNNINFAQQVLQVANKYVSGQTSSTQQPNQEAASPAARMPNLTKGGPASDRLAQLNEQMIAARAKGNHKEANKLLGELSELLRQQQ